MDLKILLEKNNYLWFSSCDNLNGEFYDSTIKYEHSNNNFIRMEI